MSFSDKLQKLREISKAHRRGELFSLGDLKIELGTISSEEEAYIQSWAVQISEDKRVSFISYYRLASIALAIKALDDLRLDQYAPDEWIETGEVLPDGTKVKKERFKFMMDMVRVMASELSTWIFERFTALTLEAAKEVDKTVTLPKIEKPPETSVKGSPKVDLRPVRQETEENEREIGQQLKNQNE